MTYVPSACVFFKPLSDAVPFALFEEMEQNVPGSFFGAPHLTESAQAGALNLRDLCTIPAMAEPDRELIFGDHFQ